MTDLAIAAVIAVLLFVGGNLVARVVERLSWRWAGRFKSWHEVQALVLEGNGCILISGAQEVRWSPAVVASEEEAVWVFEESYVTECPRRLRTHDALCAMFGNDRVILKVPDQIDATEG